MKKIFNVVAILVALAFFQSAHAQINAASTPTDNRAQPSANDIYVAFGPSGSDSNNGRLSQHGGTGPKATLRAALLAAPAGAYVYIYNAGGNVTIDFPRLGVSYAGVANNVHLSSWPGQFHRLVANNLPGNDVATGTPGAMGIFEFGPGTNNSGLKFSHFEVEALLNVWAFLDNSNSSGRSPNGEIFNVVARLTGDTIASGAPHTHPNARWDSNSGIVHFEENDKNNPVNDGWEIHHSVFEHSLPPSSQSPNMGAIYILGQRDINVHHMHFNNLKSAMFYKWASSGSPNNRLTDSVINNTEQPLWGAARGATVRNNVIVGESNWSVLTNDNNNGTPGGLNVTIEHNTFVDGGIFWLNSSGTPPQNFVIRNNIFLGSDYFSSTITSDTGAPAHIGAMRADHNVWQKSRALAMPEQDPAGAGNGSSFSATPSFVNANSRTPQGYRLAGSSVGAGASTSGSDIGANVAQLTGWMWGSANTSPSTPTPPAPTPQPEPEPEPEPEPAGDLAPPEPPQVNVR